MLGFMVVTAFISMWITNTATTAMMTPIMEAVLKQLDKEYLPNKSEEPTSENEESQVENQEENSMQDEKIPMQDEKASHIDSEANANEMLELAAPIHPRNTSKRGLIYRYTKCKLLHLIHCRNNN